MTQDQSPGARAIRIWAGMLVGIWILALCGAVMVSYLRVESYVQQRVRDAERADEAEEATVPAPHEPGYWHASTVALASALLAMLFLVGGVELILGQRWAWRLLVGVATVQMAVTVGTQVWQAALPPEGHDLPGGELGFLGAAIGILLWNVVPVGILILAAAAGRMTRARTPTLAESEANRGSI
jgi:hypothetical protein